MCRLDWNLLSTATPAINAWMNPGHRAMVAGQMLLSTYKHRINIVMACIMTEALDVQNIHMPVKVSNALSLIGVQSFRIQAFCNSQYLK